MDVLQLSRTMDSLQPLTIQNPDSELSEAISTKCTFTGAFPARSDFVELSVDLLAAVELHEAVLYDSVFGETEMEYRLMMERVYAAVNPNTDIDDAEIDRQYEALASKQKEEVRVHTAMVEKMKTRFIDTLERAIESGEVTGDKAESMKVDIDNMMDALVTTRQKMLEDCMVKLEQSQHKAKWDLTIFKSDQGRQGLKSCPSELCEILGQRIEEDGLSNKTRWTVLRMEIERFDIFVEKQGDEFRLDMKRTEKRLKEALGRA